MTDFTSTKLADVEAYCAIVSKAEGYPKAGVRVGGGIHAPPELGVTHRHVEPIKHPDRAEWRAPVDAKAVAAQTSKALTVAEKNSLSLAVASAKSIDASWEPKAIVDVEADSPPKELTEEPLDLKPE